MLTRMMRALSSPRAPFVLAAAMTVSVIAALFYPVWGWAVGALGAVMMFMCVCRLLDFMFIDGWLAAKSHYDDVIQQYVDPSVRARAYAEVGAAPDRRVHQASVARMLNDLATARTPSEQVAAHDRHRRRVWGD